MATLLRAATAANGKPVRATTVYRETMSTVRDRSKQRPLIVGLVPGDVIEIRPKGTRKRFSLPIAHAYIYAVRLEGERMKRERAAKRKARREGLV